MNMNMNMNMKTTRRGLFGALFGAVYVVLPVFLITKAVRAPWLIKAAKRFTSDVRHIKAGETPGWHIARVYLDGHEMHGVVEAHVGDVVVHVNRDTGERWEDRKEGWVNVMTGRIDHDVYGGAMKLVTLHGDVSIRYDKSIADGRA